MLVDVSDSKAAVDAMAALQARIRELEAGNARLRRECAKLKESTEKDEASLSEREAAILGAADRAQQMLDGASETLTELRRIKRENRNLRKQLEQMESDLEAKLADDQKKQESIARLNKKRTDSARLIHEFEELFKEILAPPDLHFDELPLIPFNTSVSQNTYSLPATLQTVIHELQTLPTPFRDQKLEKKREIINVLCAARDIAERIAAEIRELRLKQPEEGSVRRIQAELSVKASHFSLITQAMGRFRFE